MLTFQMAQSIIFEGRGCKILLELAAHEPDPIGDV